MDPLAASSQKQIIGLEKPKGRKMPKEIEQLKTKPVDYATNVQLRKLDEEKRTIL